MGPRIGVRVTLVLVGIILATAALHGTIEASAASHPQHAGSFSALAPAGPPEFADSGVVGQRIVLELRSARSGLVIKRLRAFRSSFTNNGLALSSESDSLSSTLTPQIKPRSSNRLIEKISTLTGALEQIAHGEAPAVSRDGRQLAYVTGPHARSIAVRDLSSGRTRFIDVTDLVGDQADVINGVLTWLSGGRQVALVTTTTRPDFSAGGPGHRIAPRAGAHGACSHSAVRVCLVVLNLSDDQSVITATTDALPDPFSPITAIGGDIDSPRSILVAHLGSRDSAVMERVTLNGQSLRISQLVAIRAGLVVSFDTGGTP
jgi:hypothetical protein